ncbi:hypothetical protein [Pseudoalteromonas luteoviolacea]|uniref:hypothetical protein n=1 Tax=Pseudoalteromonas luteoviolacea TaxID=43657 RepID=UPI0012DA3E60|nr:hypothetical protein [Pseudoalteromonas luteoviolacea]
MAYANSDLTNEVKKLSYGKDKKIQLQISNEKTIEVTISKTMKGNGIVKFGSYGYVTVFDVHDNGFVYGGEVLDIDVLDIDKDGIKEIIISGVINETSDEGEVLDSYSAVIIYKFFDGEFVKVFSKSPIEISYFKEG